MALFNNENNLLLRQQLLRPGQNLLNGTGSNVKAVETVEPTAQNSGDQLAGLTSSYSNGTISPSRLQEGLTQIGGKIIGSGNGNSNNGSFRGAVNGKTFQIYSPANTAVESYYTYSDLINKYKLSGSVINKYFEVAPTLNWGSVNAIPVSMKNNIVSGNGIKSSGTANNRLNSLTQNISNNISNTRYRLKSDCGFKSISELLKHLEKFDDYKNDLILDNFLSGKAQESDAVNSLYCTEDGTTLTAANYDEYIKEIGLASGDKAKELKQKALDKLLKDYSSGNLSYRQANTVLNAIGVDNQQYNSNDGKYTFSFSFNGKNYSITCNKEAAKSGVDNIQTKTYTPEEYNAIPEDIRAEYLEAAVSIDGTGTVYTLKAGKTEDELRDATINYNNKHISYTQGEMVRLQVSSQIAPDVIEKYFDLKDGIYTIKEGMDYNGFLYETKIVSVAIGTALIAGDRSIYENFDEELKSEFMEIYNSFENCKTYDDVGSIDGGSFVSVEAGVRRLFDLIKEHSSEIFNKQSMGGLYIDPAMIDEMLDAYKQDLVNLIYDKFAEQDSCNLYRNHFYETYRGSGDDGEARQAAEDALYECTQDLNNNTGLNFEIYNYDAMMAFNPGKGNKVEDLAHILNEAFIAQQRQGYDLSSYVDRFKKLTGLGELDFNKVLDKFKDNLFEIYVSGNFKNDAPDLEMEYYESQMHELQLHFDRQMELANIGFDNSHITSGGNYQDYSTPSDSGLSINSLIENFEREMSSIITRMNEHQKRWIFKGVEFPLYDYNGNVEYYLKPSKEVYDKDWNYSQKEIDKALDQGNVTLINKYGVAIDLAFVDSSWIFAQLGCMIADPQTFGNEAQENYVNNILTSNIISNAGSNSQFSASLSYKAYQLETKVYSNPDEIISDLESKFPDNIYLGEFKESTILYWFSYILSQTYDSMENLDNEKVYQAVLEGLNDMLQTVADEESYDDDLKALDEQLRKTGDVFNQYVENNETLSETDFIEYCEEQGLFEFELDFRITENKLSGLCRNSYYKELLDTLNQELQKVYPPKHHTDITKAIEILYDILDVVNSAKSDNALAESENYINNYLEKIENAIANYSNASQSLNAIEFNLTNLGDTEDEQLQILKDYQNGGITIPKNSTSSSANGPRLAPSRGRKLLNDFVWGLKDAIDSPVGSFGVTLISGISDVSGSGGQGSKLVFGFTIGTRVAAALLDPDRYIESARASLFGSNQDISDLACFALGFMVDNFPDIIGATQIAYGSGARTAAALLIKNPEAKQVLIGLITDTIGISNMVNMGKLMKSGNTKELLLFLGSMAADISNIWGRLGTVLNMRNNKSNASAKPQIGGSHSTGRDFSSWGTNNYKYSNGLSINDVDKTETVQASKRYLKVTITVSKFIPPSGLSDADIPGAEVTGSYDPFIDKVYKDTLDVMGFDYASTMSNYKVENFRKPKEGTCGLVTLKITVYVPIN